MKKMLALCLALLCLLTALPSLAEEAQAYFRKRPEEAPFLSDALCALQAANAALAEKYGLTLAALGLFDVRVDVCGTSAIVTYTGYTVPESLTGTYYVILTPESTQALWSHDGTDVPWQDGALSSPVWGMPQLQKYLDATPGERYTDILPYFPADVNKSLALKDAGGSVLDVSSENRADADTAKAMAAEAVRAVFALTDAQASQLTTCGGDTWQLVYPDGHSEWEVTLHLEDGSNAEVDFFVTLDGERWTILEMEVISGGIG